MVKGSSVPKLFLLSIANVCMKIIDLLMNILLGWTITGGTLKEQQDGERYEKSAHIVDIVMEAKPFMAKTTKLSNFLYRHNRYVHPEYILMHKNVTLMGVEKDRVLFAVSDPTVSVYDTSVSPYFNMLQYTTAKQLVILPMRSFHRLAGSLGDPKVPVALVAMTARCGSTLLVQMFSKVSGTRVMSEPNGTLGIHEMRAMGKITPKESKVMLRSAIRLACKVEPNSVVERIFIKLGTRQGIQVEDIKALFPDFKYFFNTRHPLPTLKSSLRGLTPFSNLLFVRLGLIWLMPEATHARVTYDEDSKHHRIWESFRAKLPKEISERIVLGNYTQAILPCFKNKKLFGDRVILYEDLISDPEVVTKKIFAHMGIDYKHLPAALDAMKKDAKLGGSFTKSKDTPLDQEFLDKFDFFMKELGLPLRHDMTEKEFRNCFKS